MALVLKQLRKCDGSCCRESPRFPTVDGKDCIYHIAPNGKETSGCELMLDAQKIPLAGVKSYPFPELDAKDVFKTTCVDWPHNMPGRSTGNCCWQWVDDGN